jgi:excisionase family DNA binding protein
MMPALIILNVVATIRNLLQTVLDDYRCGRWDSTMSSVKEQREQLRQAGSARSAATELRAHLDSLPTGEPDVKVTLAGESSERAFVVPRPALDRMLEILEALGDGHEPCVMPADKELSTGDVASLLGVSRQYAVRLVDDGRLPSRRVGNRRRVPLRDALAYRRRDDQRRSSRLREVMTESS